MIFWLREPCFFSARVDAAGMFLWTVLIHDYQMGRSFVPSATNSVLTYLSEISITELSSKRNLYD